MFLWYIHSIAIRLFLLYTSTQILAMTTAVVKLLTKLLFPSQTTLVVLSHDDTSCVAFLACASPRCRIMYNPQEGKGMKRLDHPVPDAFLSAGTKCRSLYNLLALMLRLRFLHSLLRFCGLGGAGRRWVSGDECSPGATLPSMEAFL